MLLGLERERVDVDTNGGDVGVVLVRLDQVEVLALTLGEAIVAVELNLGGDDGVLAGLANKVANVKPSHGAISPVRVVERLLAVVLIHRGVAGHERVALDNPDKLLRGVVEVELDLVRRGGDRLTARELELLDQVLVRDLGEAAALIRVEVDVVDIERRGHKAGGGNLVGDALLAEAEVAELVELEPDLDLVVLEGDERKRKTRVAAEPELEGDVQGVLRSAVACNIGGARGARRAITIAANSVALLEKVRQLRDVANHLGVTGLLAGLLRELVPDVEPVTVVLVNLLTADLNVDVVDEIVANPVEPAELLTADSDLHLRECGLEVDAVDEIAVAADRALNLLAEVGRTVEGLLDGLHGEVRVATVNDLEDKVIPSLSGYFGAVPLQGLDYNLSPGFYT